MSRNLLPISGDGQNRAGRLGYEGIGQLYDPATTEVMGAYFNSALRGPGSTLDDLLALELEREMGLEGKTGVIQRFSEFLTPDSWKPTSSQPSGVKLSKEEWEASPFFHPAVEYTEGMTTRAADIYKQQADFRATNQFIIDQSSGIAQTGLGYAAGFTGGLLDAKAAVVGAVAAAATPFIVGGATAPAALPVGAGAGVVAGVARLGPALARMGTAGLHTLQTSRKARLAAAAGEGFVSTIPQAATGLQNASLTQQDYEVSDAILDFAAGTGFSFILQGATEGVRSAWRRYSTPDQATEVYRLVAAQLEAGERVNVDPLVRTHLSDNIPTRVDVPEPTVRQLPDGRWEASVDNQVFVGRTQQEVTVQARESAIADSLEPYRELGYSPEALARMEEIVRLRQEITPDAVTERLLEVDPRLTKVQEQLTRAEAALASAPKSQKKNAQRLVESARNRVDDTRAALRAEAGRVVEAQRARIEERVAVVEGELRKVLRGEAVAPMPDFTRAQLDSSPEARAARSINPEAARAVAEPIPVVKEVEVEAPPESAVAQVEDALDDTRASESIKKALAETQTVLDTDWESHIERFIRCRAGR